MRPFRTMLDTGAVILRRFRVASANSCQMPETVRAIHSSCAQARCNQPIHASRELENPVPCAHHAPITGTQQTTSHERAALHAARLVTGGLPSKCVQMSWSTRDASFVLPAADSFCECSRANDTRQRRVAQAQQLGFVHWAWSARLFRNARVNLAARSQWTHSQPGVI